MKKNIITERKMQLKTLNSLKAKNNIKEIMKSIMVQKKIQILMPHKTTMRARCLILLTELMLILSK